MHNSGIINSIQPKISESESTHSIDIVPESWDILREKWIFDLKNTKGNTFSFFRRNFTFLSEWSSIPAMGKSDA